MSHNSHNCKIEGGGDFYSELTKALKDVDDYNEDKCLITNTRLENNFVTLECNHKFNYLPLFKDVTFHKNHYNILESRRLKYDEIRCPYCRNVQNTLLPYYENKKIPKIHGVNYIDELELFKTQQCIYQEGVCCFIVDNSNTEYKIACPKKMVTFIPCVNQTYCSVHKYAAIHKYMIDSIKKEKQEKVDAKIKAKQEKEDAKLKKQHEKTAKEDAKIKKQQEKTAKEEAKIKKQQEKTAKEEAKNKKHQLKKLEKIQSSTDS